MVHTGADALEVCAEQELDVLLLDISLPDVSGVELISRIEKSSPDLDILIITGHASLDSAVHAVSRSTIGYMIKPLDLDRLLGVLERIARRRRVEAENQRLMSDLRRAKGEWESTFDSISDPIAVVDSQGSLVRVNRAFCRRFNTAPERAVGLPAGALLFGGSKPESAIIGPFQAGDPFIEEREDLAIPGVFEVARHPVDLGDNHGNIFILRDVSARKAAEREREELISQLEQQNAELERYAYTVSHDLKSPLITITGFLGLVERSARERDEQGLRSAIEHISMAGKQMKQMLDELLELSRLGRSANPSEEVPLSELVREAASQIKPPRDGREIDIVVAPDLPTVRCDRVRMFEVFQNLLDNAVKFMGEQPAPRVEVGQRLGAGKPVIYVADNGIGIEERYHDKIFGLFDKLDRAGDGTGIGLALVKRIVEVHGGRIWVESAGEGGGSAFCFTVSPAGPLHLESTQPAFLTKPLLQCRICPEKSGLGGVAP